MPGNPLVIKQGVNFDAIIEPFDDDAATVRTALAGWRVVLQARTRAGDPNLILDLASDDGTGRFIVENATDGPEGQWVRMHLDAAETAAVHHPGVWQLVRIDPADATNADEIVTDVLQVERQVVTQ